MNDSNSNETPGCAEADAASALIELRDALVDLSLTMKDLMFEVDFIRRGAAIEKFAELIEKVKLP